MSKRKLGEQRGEDGLGGASKKMKTSHAESSASQKQEGDQETGGLAAPNAGLTGKGFKRARDRARKERRKARRELQDESQPVDKDDSVEGTEQNALGKPAKKKKKLKKHTQNGSGWQVSEAVGGQLVDLDPVFSVDEKYLLLAYESSIRIYATSTSLLVRALSTDQKHGSITGFALSAVDPSHLYVCMNQGLVEKWDWDAGQRLGKWAISSQLFGIAITSKLSNDSEEDLVYTVEYYRGSWVVTGNYLRDKKGLQPTEEHKLLKSVDPITSFKLLDSGRVLAVSAGKRLITGQLASPTSVALKDVTYTWREIVCPNWITSMDARSNNDHNEAIKKPTSTGGATVSTAVDVVIGDLKGSIFVYRNLLGGLIEKEKKRYAAAPVSQHLHWHRNVVGAVKWSRDGNYIISGGAETVMVLWQLDTGQQQLLPHLSAPIESLVVSPAGSSYAVRLADNSAMVLSTAELQPTVSVSGLQIAIPRRPIVQIPDVPRVSEASDALPIFRRFAAVASKSVHGQLLLAVPGSLPSRTGVTDHFNAAYLQTLDIRSGTQTARQALTRTKVTDKNIGPESNIIEEPNVVLLQTSHDGKWLATVEEWTPPRQDIQFLSIDEEGATEEQKLHMEIYLKFWQWDEASKQWELVSRIEAPHLPNGSSSDSTGRVLDLVEDPSSTGFATFGDEGMLKFWKPKPRSRDGIKVRGKNGHILVTWICRSAIPLTTQTTSHKPSQLHARLAFSLDGSLLAAALSSTSTSLLYLIDAFTNTIHSVRADIFSTLPTAIGILDRYLILLASTLTVWDLVDDRLVHELALPTSSLPPPKQRAATHLALDPRAHTFALAVPEITKAGAGIAVRARLAVFDPALPTPLFTTILPHALLALLPTPTATGPHRAGYIAIDAAAEIRTLTPTLRLPLLPIEDKPEPAAPRGLDNVFGTSIGSLLDKAQAPGGMSLVRATAGGAQAAEEEDSVAIRPQQLAEIFEAGNAFALPAVAALFERVAGLVVGRGVEGG